MFSAARSIKENIMRLHLAAALLSIIAAAGPLAPQAHANVLLDASDEAIAAPGRAKIPGARAPRAVMPAAAPAAINPPLMRPEDEEPIAPSEDVEQPLPEPVQALLPPEDEDDGLLPLPRGHVAPVDPWIEPEFGGPSRGHILRSLHEQGFSEIDRLRRRGSVFVAEATGPMGDRMRVVVDARTGDIQGLRVLERADGQGWRRSELEFLER